MALVRPLFAAAATPLAGLLARGRPLVMGILNVTPDSFSDGGRFLDPSIAIAHARTMAAQGADLIDVGAESTRPYGGNKGVNADDELARLKAVLTEVVKLGLPVSIDTIKASTAAWALGEGASIQHVFELVLRLKQICTFDPVTGASAKLERLAADLEEVAASGQKALVFSQWVHTLDKLGERLAGYRPLAYHGGVPSKKRDDVIREFKEDRRRPLLLISYGAGSVGLNLQFAQYVFLFDRWWNPAVEDQAINRVHRIGAAGPVTVTRFLTLQTIEERINQILEEKREIFDTIFSDTEPHKHSGLSRQEIFGLFQLKCPAGAIDLAA